MVKVRQQLGKYRIEKRLAEGGFAAVYRALDTIEGIPVALKIPHAHLLTKHAMDDFRKEVRITAKLDHPNILPIKNATYIDDRFVIVYPLGQSTLADRLTKRLSIKTAMNFAEQMLVAVAAAHERKIVHLDVKPDNFIIFNNDRLRLTDFGIAKVAQRTIEASGAGTVGYIAPEQAMGRPSPRSDVFALGIIIYRMITGYLPEWPFEWPPEGFDRLKRAMHPQFIAFLRRAMAVDQRERYADARRMLEAFRRIKPRAIKHHLNGKVDRKSKRRASSRRAGGRTWKTVRVREFLRRFKKPLEIRCTCESCGEPVAETMRGCPWCGTPREKHLDETALPARCPRCKRGMKLDWRFCAHCYGPAIGPFSTRQFTDKRYSATAKCANRSCERRSLMPYSRYCPWCRTKVRHKWAIPGAKDRCPSCKWGVVSEFWDYCPWCVRKLG